MVGTAVLHDFSEVLLECSKVFHYNKKTLTANIMFSLFGLYAFVRMYYFPRYFILPWYNGEFEKALGFWPFTKL
jgi:hypothetical protein